MGLRRTEMNIENNHCYADAEIETNTVKQMLQKLQPFYGHFYANADLETTIVTQMLK